MAVFALMRLSILPSLLLIFCFYKRAVADTPVCYNVTSDISPKDLLPCDPSAEISQCCLPGWICYSNSLCAAGPDISFNGENTYYVLGCTDLSLQGALCQAERICIEEQSSRSTRSDPKEDLQAPSCALPKTLALTCVSQSKGLGYRRVAMVITAVMDIVDVIAWTRTLSSLLRTLHLSQRCLSAPRISPYHPRLLPAYQLLR